LPTGWILPTKLAILGSWLRTWALYFCIPVFRAQHFLYFNPDPQGHGSFRPAFWFMLAITT
jgi:hypothetical protein